MLSKEKKKKKPNKTSTCFQSFYFSEKVNVKLCSLNTATLLLQLSCEDT